MWDILDPALTRPGRFDRHVKVDDPDEEARISIFKVHTKEMPLADDIDIELLAKKTEGFVGADIEAVCREAVMLTLRENIDSDKVDLKHFKEAIKKVKPKNESRSKPLQIIKYKNRWRIKYLISPILFYFK